MVFKRYVDPFPRLGVFYIIAPLLQRKPVHPDPMPCENTDPHLTFEKYAENPGPSLSFDGGLKL